MKAFEWKPYWKRKGNSRPRKKFCGSYFWLWFWIIAFLPLAFLYWEFRQGVIYEN